MKFAFALAAVVSAEQIVLPTISWDNKAIEAGVNTWAQYGKQAEALDKKNAQANARDLAKAFATFETQVGVNYAKFVKPYERAKLRYLNYITVDGKCNTEAASQCVYKAYGLEGPAVNPQGCLKAAGCQTKWDKLTPAQQQKAIAAYNTWKNKQDQASGATLHKVGQAVDAKLQVAMKNAHARDEAAKKLWQTALIKYAKQMNCDVACSDKCSGLAPEQTIPCLETCGGCYKNIVNIKWAKKVPGPAKLEAIEEAFGPVENLADHEWENIAETFAQADL